MKRRFQIFFAAGSLITTTAHAGPMQRIGHTTLEPLHTSPTDKGMYAAAIDPTNGYAYFVGAYLWKLDITGNLPVPVCAPFYVGQFTHGTIDVPAGYVYFTKSSVSRFSLGVGTNSPSFVNSLTPAIGMAQEMVIDDSDPNPANHYGYAICAVSGGAWRVSKVALGTFTEINSIPLNASETNFFFGATADAAKGYAYFAGGTGGTAIPFVVKIKMTPGTNLPVRIGACNLDTAPESLDGGCIDTVHGYAYYDTYDSDTNNPGIVYKMQLGNGDVPPSLAGETVLHAGEGRLAAAVADPQNNFVYIANDNTYPGDVCQLSMNGTNAPIEINYLGMQGGTNNNTPLNGVTGSNMADDGTNLPYGEVYFRSGVIDLVRGYAYFGQDSRPNQVVKIRLAKPDPFKLGAPHMQTNGALQFSFTNIAGASFTAIGSSNLSQPTTNWSAVGNVTEILPGQYQFTDTSPPSGGQRFYRLHTSN